MRRVFLALTVLALSGCVALPAPTTEPVAETVTSDVPWDNYPSGLRQIIDDEAAAGDCEFLQGAFDVWANSDESFREQYGEGNTAIMTYIDDAMRNAGCFP